MNRNFPLKLPEWMPEKPPLEKATPNYWLVEIRSENKHSYPLCEKVVKYFQYAIEPKRLDYHIVDALPGETEGYKWVRAIMLVPILTTSFSQENQVVLIRSAEIKPELPEWSRRFKVKLGRNSTGDFGSFFDPVSNNRVFCASFSIAGKRWYPCSSGPRILVALIHLHHDHKTNV